MGSREHYALEQRLQQLTVEPWRNGGGATRTLASDGDAAGGAWHWRISVAEITRDGAYSRFDGVERQQALIGGTELLLRGARGTQRLAIPGDTFAFAGEDDVFAAVPSGPVRMWNVMTVRGKTDAVLRPVALGVGDELELRVLPPLSRAWLLVLAGELLGDAGMRCAPGDVLDFERGAEPPLLRAGSDGARVLLTTLLRRTNAP